MRTEAPPAPTARRPLLIYVALPLAYLVCGWIGLLLAVPPGYATAVFLPAGVAVTAAFLAGAATLPPIFLASLLLNLWVGQTIQPGWSGTDVAAALAIAAASTLQAAIGGAALRRAIGVPAALDHPREIVTLLALTPAICLVSATLSVAALWALGVIPAAALASNWMNWWVGDTLGLLVTLPVMLSFLCGPDALWCYRRRFVALPMLLSFGLFVLFYVNFQSWAVLAAGALSTGLLGSFLLLGTGHAFRIEALSEKLRRSEQELHGIINSTPFMLTRCSRDLVYRFVSPAYAQMLGRRPEEIAGQPIVSVMGEEGFDAIRPHVRKVLEGERVEYESEIQFAGAGKRFLHVVYMPERDEAGQVQGWIASILDVTERKRAEETEKILVREVEHRSNNMLAVIQAIAHRSLSGTMSVAEAKATFEARLQALARANRQLTRSSMTGLSMADVVRLELDPFAARTVVKGEDIRLDAQTAQHFALVLHELATNAVKHGALSNADGKVEISWKVVEADGARTLNFSWRERGGPPVTSPQRSGFGTALLKATFPDSELDYRPDGVICTITARLT